MRELMKWACVLDRSMSSYLDKKLAGLEINSSQYFYILRVCESPGMTQDRVLQTVYRNPSNITRALAQLEEKGYLIKKQSLEDRRTCHLYPTERADRAYDQIVAIVTETVQEVLRSLEQEERAAFIGMLQKVSTTAFALNQSIKEEKGETKDEASRTE